ncbi:MAG: hypothetical protein HKN24_05170 [Acidimicrobiales bacterium]|nr:hypothetical protein [Acidimicrobiales bacterium]
MSSWFEKLVGFRESAVSNVADHFLVDNEYITSTPNGRRIRYGRFETLTLAQLRTRVDGLYLLGGRPKVREVVADVKSLHADAENANTVFQVASQFNTLEMVGPGVTPDSGITQYEHDHTQGPACAMSCGGGLIYRNYLVPLGRNVGQTAFRQLNLLATVSAAMGVDIPVRNGYALPSTAQLNEINDRLAAMTDLQRDRVRSQFAIGVQWNTEVTLNDAGHTVTQVFCSAMPISYSPVETEVWEPLARLTLEAAYESTIAVGTVNAHLTGNRTVYLTLLGGGAFGNPTEWILNAIDRAVRLTFREDLDIVIVSFGRPNPELGRLLTN